MRACVTTITISRVATCLLLPSLSFADALDDRMRTEAQAVNRQAPMMADKSTRLDSAGYDERNRLFCYHYTMINHPSTVYSPAQRQKFRTLMQEQTTNRACTGSALRPFLDAGISFKYVHFGNDSRQISEFVVTPDDCKAPAARQETAPKNAGKTSHSATGRDAPIKSGDAYDSVMEKLKGYDATKKVYGGWLDAEFRDPTLVAYPDAGGVCKLTFDNGRLFRCQGCKPGRFKCSE